MVVAARHAIKDLRGAGSIGEDAYRTLKEELDLMDLSAQPTETEV